MTQEKSQQNNPAGEDERVQSSGANASSESESPSAHSSGRFSPPHNYSSSFSVGTPNENVVNESSINHELRRLNRALRTLSACSQALAEAGSEPDLLQHICE